MMIENGFHNVVDIYPYKYNDDINSANDGYFDKDEVMRDIPCRIRSNNEFGKTKLFFSNDIKIKTGDGIYDKQEDIFYTVDNVKTVCALANSNHITCFISKSFEKVDVLNE